MAKQIILQPNGKYCLFSSVVDNVTDYDLDRDGLVEAFLATSRRDIEARVDETLEWLEDPAHPRHKRTRDYTEVLETISAVHGQEEADKVHSLTSAEATPAEEDKEIATLEEAIAKAWTLLPDPATCEHWECRVPIMKPINPALHKRTLPLDERPYWTVVFHKRGGLDGRHYYWKLQSAE